MATAPIYCTHKQLKRVYPQIDAFDAKTSIYGFSLLGECARDEATGQSVYIAENTGLVSNLFIDGQDMQSRLQTLTSVGSGVDVGTDTAEVVAVGENEITTDSGGNALADPGWVVGLGLNGEVESTVTELMLIKDTATSDTIKVRRAFNGTAEKSYTSNANIYYYLTMKQKGQWYYNSNDDCLLLTWDSDPNDLLVEAGEDFTTMITQFRTDASRYLDSKLDPNLPREQLKDKSGNFDYMIIRSASLIAAAFLIRATDPTNEIASALMEEAQGNIDALNSGGAALSWQTTRDASKGIIRDVSYTDGSVRPVDTRGNWGGTFDLIRVKIETGGALDGTATYSVWVKNADKLGIQQGSQVVTAEKINGDYQALAGGLQIRFAGENKTSVATATNEWEIEVMGVSEHIDASGVKSVANSRWLN